MTDFKYLLQDAYSLDVIGFIPFVPTAPYWRLLTGSGSFTGDMPLDHPLATRATFKDRATNLIVLRDNEVDWWGLITNPEPNEDERTVTLSAREPTIWWQMRTIEVDKHYNGDLCFVVRKLWTYVTTKTDSGSINANLDNIGMGTGNAGVTRDIVLAGPACHYMQDVIDWMTENDTGLEYRCDYSAGTSILDPQCTVKIGAGLGSTKTQVIRDTGARVGRGLDWNPQRGATRTHAVGAGFTATKQNTGSVTAGLPLMELVLNRSNISDHDLLNDAAREARRKAQPPVQTYDVEFTANSDGLTYDTFNPGDTVPIDTNGTDLTTITGVSRRIIGVGIMPAVGAIPASVALQLNLPLSDLGV